VFQAGPVSVNAHGTVRLDTSSFLPFVRTFFGQAVITSDVPVFVSATQFYLTLVSPHVLPYESVTHLESYPHVHFQP
jgi:hypothetical protein